MLVLFLIPLQDIPVSNEIPHLDKFVHVFIFMVFTILYIRDQLKSSGLKRLVPGYILTTFLVVLLFATMIELLQEMMNTGREGDIFDILCDLTGFTLGLFIVIMLHRVRSLFL
jgi:VanZ family protein